MVSRSLEKMMLIAVGLSTAVIIGVPILLYAIDTMTTTQQIEFAHQAAEEIFDAAQQVDSGDLNELTIQVYIPPRCTMKTDESGSGLVIMLVTDPEQPEYVVAWTESFEHQIVVSFPSEAGEYYLTFSLISDVIHITYSITSS